MQGETRPVCQWWRSEGDGISSLRLEGASNLVLFPCRQQPVGKVYFSRAQTGHTFWGLPSILLYLTSQPQLTTDEYIKVFQYWSLNTQQLQPKYKPTRSTCGGMRGFSFYFETFKTLYYNSFKKLSVFCLSFIYVMSKFNFQFIYFFDLYCSNF